MGSNIKVYVHVTNFVPPVFKTNRPAQTKQNNKFSNKQKRNNIINGTKLTTNEETKTSR